MEFPSSNCANFIKKGYVPFAVRNTNCYMCKFRRPNVYLDNLEHLKTEFGGSLQEVVLVTESGCYLRK